MARIGMDEQWKHRSDCEDAQSDQCVRRSRSLVTISLYFLKQAVEAVLSGPNGKITQDRRNLILVAFVIFVGFSFAPAQKLYGYVSVLIVRFYIIPGALR